MPRLAQVQGADAPAAGKVARTWSKPGTKQGAEQGNSVKYASMPHEISAGSYAIHSKHEPSCWQCRVWCSCKALMRQRHARWRAHGANLEQSKARGQRRPGRGAGSDMAVFFGAVQHMGIKLRASTAADAAPGQQEVVLRHNLSGEEDILRGVEWLQVGGQAYRLELQGLAAEDAYQALAGYVLQADAQELVLVGLPGF